AAENIAGHRIEMSGHVPNCTYTDPEVASVGMNETAARERFGDDVATGQFPYSAIARAAMFADRTGFMKTIHQPSTRALRGLVVAGCGPTARTTAGVLGPAAEATTAPVGDSIAAPPTLSEGVKEAALVALERPIHFPPRRKKAATA